MCSPFVCTWVQEREMEETGVLSHQRHPRNSPESPPFITSPDPVKKAPFYHQRRNLWACLHTSCSIKSIIHWGSQWVPSHLLPHVNLCSNMCERRKVNMQWGVSCRAAMLCSFGGNNAHLTDPADWVLCWSYNRIIASALRPWASKCTITCM